MKKYLFLFLFFNTAYPNKFSPYNESYRFDVAAYSHEKKGEDYFVAHTIHQKGFNFKILAVFDGHGGPQAASLATEWVPTFFREGYHAFNNTKEALTYALYKTNANIQAHNTMLELKDGTTAAIAVIDEDGYIEVATVGDSWMLFSINNGSYFKPTKSHTPETRAAAIEGMGGKVENIRGVARIRRNSIGPAYSVGADMGGEYPDLMFDIATWSGHVKDIIGFIIASDGLKDDEETHKLFDSFMRSFSNPKEIARHLGSTFCENDDVTVLCALQSFNHGGYNHQQIALISALCLAAGAAGVYAYYNDWWNRFVDWAHSIN